MEQALDRGEISAESYVAQLEEYQASQQLAQKELAGESPDGQDDDNESDSDSGDDNSVLDPHYIPPEDLSDDEDDDLDIGDDIDMNRPGPSTGKRGRSIQQPSKQASTTNTGKRKAAADSLPSAPTSKKSKKGKEPIRTSAAAAAQSDREEDEDTPTTAPPAPEDLEEYDEEDSEQRVLSDGNLLSLEALAAVRQVLIEGHGSLVEAFDVCTTLPRDGRCITGHRPGHAPIDDCCPFCLEPLDEVIDLPLHHFYSQYRAQRLVRIRMHTELCAQKQTIAAYGNEVLSQTRYGSKVVP